MESRTENLRKRAFLGAIPDDFLRVSSRSSSREDAQEPRLHPISYPGGPAVMRQQPYLIGGGYENIAGKLTVTVNQAKLVKNYGLTRMDPYCRVRIGHAVYETPTSVNGSKNPRWNKNLICQLPRGVNSMYIEIFNERVVTLDDRIAWAHYEFTDELLNGNTVEEWISLSGKQGDDKEGVINVILSFSAYPSPQVYQGHQMMSVVPPGMPAAQVYQYGGYPPPMVNPAFQPTSGGGQPPYPPAQQAPPSGPSPQVVISDEDIKKLQEMFPNLEKDVIRSVMEANGGNVEASINGLLSM